MLSLKQLAHIKTQERSSKRFIGKLLKKQKEAGHANASYAESFVRKLYRKTATLLPCPPRGLGDWILKLYPDEPMNHKLKYTTGWKQAKGNPNGVSLNRIVKAFAHGTLKEYWFHISIVDVQSKTLDVCIFPLFPNFHLFYFASGTGQLLLNDSYFMKAWKSGHLYMTHNMSQKKIGRMLQDTIRVGNKLLFKNRKDAEKQTLALLRKNGKL